VLLTACGGPITSPPSGSVVLTTAPAEDDLLDVDWQQATLTAEFCGVHQPVAMRNGEAKAMSETWGEVRVVVNPRKPAWFGDVDGDGHHEAAVDVHCEKERAQLAFGLVVVRAVNGAFERIGEISSTTMRDDAPHVPLLTEPRFEYGAITVKELWFRPNDESCCPTGVSQTRWSVRDGTLKAAPAVQVS
jgi:hypothetical protein